MLLYHFPLTSNSTTPNLENKGLKNDYTLESGWTFEQEGKLSSYCARTNKKGIFLRIIDNYTLCVRLKSKIEQQAYSYIIRIMDNNYTSILSLAYHSTTGVYISGLTAKMFPIDDNRWHDIILTKENNTIYIYLDGVYQNKKDVTGDINIGIGGGSNSWDCYLQDIRIYDYALSQAEINEYSRALVVHYPLQGNELNPSVLKDVSGFGNDMQRYGGSSSYDNNSPRADKSLHLVNANHCFYQGNMKWSDYKQFTISAWVYPTNNSNYRGVIGLHNSNGVNGGVCFAQFISNNITFQIYSTTRNSTLYYFNSFTIDLNKWHHFVLTYNESAEKAVLYWNGEKKQEASKNPDREVGMDLPIVIGKAFESNDRYWDGNISDVRIYATALSAEDIKNLYNSPIAVSKQHQTMAFEFKENSLYPSKYWRTPTYAEMNYILNTRTNAANLRTLGRVVISSGTYRNGLFLLPDGFVAPSGITVTITTANYTTNSYTLAQFKQLESVGVVFMAEDGSRENANVTRLNRFIYWLGTQQSANLMYALTLGANLTSINLQTWNLSTGLGIRLIHNGSKFSTSATTKIDFAPSNLQYHCTQHIWRFAQHSYDIIGAANANISDNYNGWIDLFGYGTSGVNYSPTLHTTKNSDYASGNISNTDNDWGINEIQSYDYNVKNFALNKNGIVQHNELRENDSEVNGCYQDKLITNELIEN